MSPPAKSRRLRPGDVVEVRSAAEILATLGSDAAIDKLPFMPEMARHAGRRYTVSRRVDKICDTITYTGSRRMHDTVYLEDLRCDGAGHGGCQAGCKLYWKEAWLRRVGEDASATVPNEEATARLEQLAQSGARTFRDLEGVQTEVWRCQATEAVNASHHLRGYDLGQYWREMTNGNFGPLRFARLLIRAFVMQVGNRFGFFPGQPLKGPGIQWAQQQKLGLRPGDVVKVRSASEIAPTLDGNGLNHGLSFDREMLPFCNRVLRVKDKVEKIVDDKSGRMLTIRRDCIILDGAVCSGERSISCWFCPREIHAYWREAWLSRADAHEHAASPPLPEQPVPGVRNP
jgi:hypothetical protein